MSQPPVPVLIGCSPSSGSTLLSVMLDAHPEVISGPELSLFSHPFIWREEGEVWQQKVAVGLKIQGCLPSDWMLSQGFVPYAMLLYAENLSWYGYDMAAFSTLLKGCKNGRTLFNRFFSRKQAINQASYWIEKSPPNLYAIPDFLKNMPNGKAIVLVRDGRDVVCSLMKRGFSFPEACSIWLLETAIVACLEELDHVYLLRYEDLVTCTEETIKKLFSFLGCTTGIESVLSYAEGGRRTNKDSSIGLGSWQHVPGDGISTGSVGRWKTELSDEQLSYFYSLCIVQDFDAALRFYLEEPVSTLDLMKQLDYSLPPQVKPLSLDTMVDIVQADNKPYSWLMKNSGIHRNSIAPVPIASSFSTEMVIYMLAKATAGISLSCRSLEKNISDTASLLEKTEKARQLAEDRLTEMDANYVVLQQKKSECAVELATLQHEHELVSQHVSEIKSDYLEIKKRYSTVMMKLMKLEKLTGLSILRKIKRMVSG